MSQSLGVEIKKVILVLKSQKSSGLSFCTFPYLNPGLFIVVPFLTDVFAPVLKDIPVMEILQTSRPIYSRIQLFLPLEIIDFSKKDLSPLHHNLSIMENGEQIIPLFFLYFEKTCKTFVSILFLCNNWTQFFSFWFWSCFLHPRKFHWSLLILL